MFNAKLIYLVTDLYRIEPGPQSSLERQFEPGISTIFSMQLNTLCVYRIDLPTNRRKQQ